MLTVIRREDTRTTLGDRCSVTEQLSGKDQPCLARWCHCDAPVLANADAFRISFLCLAARVTKNSNGYLLVLLIVFPCVLCVCVVQGHISEQSPTMKYLYNLSLILLALASSCNAFAPQMIPHGLRGPAPVSSKVLSRNTSPTSATALTRLV